ncbi:MAG TPA: FAD binding domain-containing protein, partial [Desulfobacteria bacterium]|nr:FAD binding domain-containing protein [Desulfobacteria bacterium]
MLLPRFDYLEPQNLEAALDLLATHRDEAKILAGGTDLLVRMKKGLLKPKALISLKSLKGLSYIEDDNDRIRIGAGTCLAHIISSEIIREKARALFEACEKVGAVTIQHHRGTIGGNILQDNRCHHYNQSDFYRSGRQACHKDGGKICYARENADRCNSTCQSDGATALMALGAKLVLISKE